MNPERPVPDDLDLEQVFRFVEEEFSCVHEQQRLVVRVASNGTRHYRNQCLACGATVEAVKAATIEPAVRDSLPPFDDTISDRWYRRKHERYTRVRKAIQERASSERKVWYSEYLDTSAWAERRLKVLTRDNWLCQGCLAASATEVHHLTYAHVGDELLHELISLCRDCHEKAHGLKEAG